MTQFLYLIRCDPPRIVFCFCFCILFFVFVFCFCFLFCICIFLYVFVYFVYICVHLCGYASQLVPDTRPNLRVCVRFCVFCVHFCVFCTYCVDTRPNLCVYTRPRYASRITCPDTRPKLTSRYASRMSYLLRYRLEGARSAFCVYTWIRVPTSCTYTRPNLCVWIRVPDTRPNFCVWIRVPTSCMDTRPD